ncbi:MAG: hypothetical protein V5B38_07665 [Candidatus Accumulibacter propinquus]|jgi:hypothetical protein
MNSREAASIPVVNRLLSASERFRWQPEKAPHGSLSIMVSDADRLLLPISCTGYGTAGSGNGAEGVRLC